MAARRYLRLGEAAEQLGFKGASQVVRFLKDCAPAALIRVPGARPLVDWDVLEERLDQHRAAPLEPTKEVQP